MVKQNFEKRVIRVFEQVKRDQNKNGEEAIKYRIHTELCLPVEAVNFPKTSLRRPFSETQFDEKDRFLRFWRVSNQGEKVILVYYLTTELNLVLISEYLNLKVISYCLKVDHFGGWITLLKIHRQEKLVKVWKRKVK